MTTIILVNGMQAAEVRQTLAAMDYFTRAITIPTISRNIGDTLQAMDFLRLK